MEDGWKPCNQETRFSFWFCHLLAVRPWASLCPSLGHSLPGCKDPCSCRVLWTLPCDSLWGGMLRGEGGRAGAAEPHGSGGAQEGRQNLGDPSVLTDHVRLQDWEPQCFRKTQWTQQPHFLSLSIYNGICQEPKRMQRLTGGSFCLAFKNWARASGKCQRLLNFSPWPAPTQLSSDCWQHGVTCRAGEKKKRGVVYGQKRQRFIQGRWELTTGIIAHVILGFRRQGYIAGEKKSIQGKSGDPISNTIFSFTE